MKPQFHLALTILFIMSAVARAADVSEMETKGFELLQLAQTQPAVIVDAAKCFAKASAEYEAAGKEEKTVEMNSYLYWCKKKMTLVDIEKFVKGGDVETATRLDKAAKPTAPGDAKQWMERAEAFAKKSPDNHLAIAIRFFEIADRFKGTESGLVAQDRSLAEMQLVGQSASAPPAPPQLDVGGLTKLLLGSWKKKNTGTVFTFTADNNFVAPRSQKPVHQKGKWSIKADTIYLNTEDGTEVRLRLAADGSLRGNLEYELIKVDPDTLAPLPISVPVPPLHSTKAEPTPATPQDPVPDAAKQKEAEKLLHEVFAADYAKTKPEDYEALIAKFNGQIAQSKDDPAARYVLMRESLTLASKIPDLLKMLALTDDICAQFKVDPAAIKKTALASAATSKDIDTAKAIGAARTLSDKPEDGAAHSTLGRYLAVKGQWSRALAHLAKSTETIVKKLAAQELAEPSEIAAKSAVADGWWDLSEKEPNKDFKLACEGHAGALYKASLAELTGLNRVKAEKRIATAESAKSETVAETKPKDVKPAAKSEDVAKTNADANVDIPANERLDIDHGLIKSGIIRSNKHLPAGVYRANGPLNWPMVSGTSYKLTMDPGVIVSNATFSLNDDGDLYAKGTAENPCIFTGVNFQGEYASHATFDYCIFDKCRFEKTGTAFSSTGAASTNWDCRHCIFDNHIFPHLGNRHYSYRFDECVFNNVIFPTIVYTRSRLDKSNTLDYFTQVRQPNTHMDSCTFIDCTLTPFFAWTVTKANLYNCRFTGNEAYDSETELIVDNYFTTITGRFPDAAKKAPVKLTPAKAPVSTPRIPDKCTLPDLQSKMKILYPEKK